MISSDIFFIIKWWLVLFTIGIIFLPLTIAIFKNFFDKGYIFARILGMVLISYVVFVIGILKILPFTELTILIVVLFFLILNILISKYLQKNTSEEPIQSPRRWPASQRGEPHGLLRGGRWKIFLFEEVLFLSTLFFWSYIRAHQADIHGLEKYMDFGFVNSIIRSEHFPPADMWLTPHSINYYYFGHLVTAVLTKLSGIPSSITYNLMLSTIFALTFTASFSIGANLISKFEARNSKQYQMTKIQNSKRKSFEHSDLENSNLFRISDFGFRILTGGLLSGFLVSLAGNLHSIYAFFKPYANENPVPFWQLAFSPQTLQNSYWYPNATRFIHNTIHEFPIYSFVVSDLHGHFLDIPFVLLTIALLLNILISKYLNIVKLLLLAFLLAIMYMTNAWDGFIYFLLASLILVYIQIKHAQKSKTLNTTNTTNVKYYKYFNIGLLVVLVSIGSILFSLPFSINFKPFASGIGVLCAPEFLTNIGKLGPFLFEKDHCLRSPIWQLAILYGFFYFFVIAFVVSIFPQIKMPQNGKLTLAFKSLAASDTFILFIILLSTFLIIIPEFIYIKDIYPGHYRANTMFKLVYQSFIMLSIASAYVAVRLISNIKNSREAGSGFARQISNWKLAYWIIGSIGLLLVSIYPYFAINSYYNLKTYQGLDGIKYLKTLYPTDYEGILWINKNIKGQPVILEAQGDSYTDYARVSSNTGLPTVLGWTVHEWLWRGTYDIPSPRIPEVQTLYESESIEDTKKLIEKYNIQLVFIGSLEKEKYPKLNEAKFKLLGKVIYQNGDTKIYKISN